MTVRRFLRASRIGATGVVPAMPSGTPTCFNDHERLVDPRHGLKSATDTADLGIARQLAVVRGTQRAPGGRTRQTNPVIVPPMRSLR